MKAYTYICYCYAPNGSLIARYGLTAADSKSMARQIASDIFYTGTGVHATTVNVTEQDTETMKDLIDYLT